MIRFSLKKLALFSIIITILFQSYYLHELVIENINLISSTFFKNEENFDSSNDFFKSKLHYNNYLSPIYQSIFKEIKPHDFLIQSLDAKCDIFFNHVGKKYSDNWEVSNFDSDTYEKDLTNKKNFFERTSAKLLEKKKKMGKPQELTLQDNITISNQFYTQFTKTLQTETKMADTTTILRVFNRCYLNDDFVSTSNKNEQICSISKKIVPWIDESLPVFERFDYATIIKDGLPVFNYSTSPDTIDPLSVPVNIYDSSKECYLHYLYKNYNSRGIAISVSNRHSRDATKLIRVLRGLNNRLPIEIIYKDDISARNKKMIIDAAREEFGDIKNRFNIEFESEYPPQELWFVNIKRTIHQRYRSKFTGYSNKLLAYILNSFDEFLLIDADTVPLVPIEDFFNTKSFKRTSTLFFKDRTLSDTNNFFETNLFSKLSSNEMDTSLFDIPAITNFTFNNHYMKGHRHLMEAGIVAFKKSQHFMGMLMSINIHLWHITQSSVWGDKEMYWLGLSLMGDENYSFNDNFAASVGEAAPQADKHYPNTISNEVCSSHPGHISSDDNKTLMWINSGFKYCKKNGYFKDKVKFPLRNYPKETIQSVFKSPLKITHALIPPVNNMNLKDTENLDYPHQGWYIQNICSGYQYCAFDILGNMTSDSFELPQENRGTFIEYDEEVVAKYSVLGRLWMGLDEA